MPDFSPGNIKPDSVASWLQTKTLANKGAIENVRHRPVVQLQDAERRVRSGRRGDRISTCDLLTPSRFGRVRSKSWNPYFSGA